MNKVNEFEHGADTKPSGRGFRKPFSVESNMHYRAENADDLINNPDKIVWMINHHHEKQCPRLAVLDDYTKGKNSGIYNDASRRSEDGKADHRAAHNFAKVINLFDVGYNTGNPIKKISENDRINEIIGEHDRLNDAENLDGELWRDFKKYGRAYELQYRNQYDEDRCVLSNVFETFVVYGLDVERTPVLAVRYPKRWDEYREYAKVTVYTDTHVYTYKETALPINELRLESVEEHYWGEIPITEYSPDRYRQGGFEDILPLIDLYDSAESDTANYMTDLNEATLVISGDLNLERYSVDELRQMKDSNMLLLTNGINPDGSKSQTSADYIYKQYDVNGTEAYKARLQSDIHKISLVPDLTDESFGGNQSGEAMKYKLFGFQQLAKASQRGFSKGLMRRYRLLLNMKNFVEEADNNDLGNLKIIFTPNLPRAVMDELQALSGAGVEFSQETLMGLASFVDDVKLEIDKLNREKEEAAESAIDKYFRQINE